MQIHTHGRPIVIVTGGAGFIGSHLVELLINNGKFVVIVDHLGSAGTKNIKHLFKNSMAQCTVHPIIIDTCQNGISALLDERFPNLPIESIYYLASPASPVHYLQYPIQTIHANTIGLENFLRIAHKHNCPILFTSTSEIYGDPQVNPQPEDYNGNVNPLTNRSVYDESKRLGETLMMTYWREYNVQSKIVRIFNTYGPKMAVDDGRVIPEFINAALNNRPLRVMGNGMQTRSFCYINDTLIRIKHVMDNLPCGEAFNIGNPKDYMNINELASTIINMTKSQSKIEYIPYISENDPQIRRPDCTKIEVEEKFKFYTPLKYGLFHTIQYFRRCNENPI